MLNLLRRLWKDEEGQGMVEYALIIVLISIAALAFLPGVGARISAIFNEIRIALGGAA